MTYPSDRPVLLVDALNVFMRHFVANPTMSDQGHHAGGIVGFLKSVRYLVDQIHPSEVCIIWEGGGSSRRRAIFKDYKSGRRPQKLNRFYGDDIPDTVENKNYQVSKCIELLKLVPVKQIYVSDCEADDVIGYLVRNKYRDRRCVIASSDRDYYQLLSGNTIQWSPGQKKFITVGEVVRKFNIHPVNFCVARCFCGDGSDAIPGIKGAGFKTLVKRFPELSSSECITVDEILTLSEQRAIGSKIKLYHNINDNQDVVRRNWRLMYLDITNLSASQIQKIDSIIDTFELSRNKIKLMRSLMQEGLLTFDADAFFMTLNTVPKSG